MDYFMDYRTVNFTVNNHYMDYFTVDYNNVDYCVEY
jgi:hypothetical protein